MNKGKKTVCRPVKALAGALVLGLSLSACATGKKDQPGTVQQVNQKVFTQKYHIHDLPNGLRVIVVPTDYPDVIAVQIPVQTGSRNEVEPGKSGFAHFFEHMMFRGTKNYSKEEYGKILKNAGADQNAYTTDDYTNYHITATKADLETILKLEADRFQNLSFTEPQFRTEALAVKGEYLKNSANPVSKLFEVVRDKAFTVHPYKHTTMGFYRDIEDMPNQMDYALQFFDRWYRPEKSALIIAGDVEPEETFKLAEKYWGSWERGSYTVDIPQEPPAAGQVYEHIQWPSSTQPWLVMAFHGPANDVQKKDKAAVDMTGELYFGDTSAIYQDLVINRRLADNLFFYAPDRKDPSLIYIGVRLTDEKHFEPVKQAIIDTIAQAQTETVDPQRLADLKSAVRYGFTNSLDNTAAIANALARVVQANRDPEDINRRFARIAEVTVEDVRNAAKRWLTDEGRVVVTLSAAEKASGFNPEFSIAQVAAAKAEKPKPQFSVLDRRNNSPIIDFNLLFNTGAAFEPEGKRGVAALTAAMLTQGGSKNRSYTEIQKAMYPMAASFGAQVDKEMLSFRGRVHQDKWDEYSELVLDSLLRPGFREDDFKRLRQQQITAIETDLKGNNDEELGKEVLYSELYRNHPYGTLNLGRVSDLENISLQDVKDFYRQQLTQGNLTVGMTGNLSDEQKQSFIERLAAALPYGNKMKVVIPPAPKLNGRHVTIVEKQTMPTAVSFGFPIDLRRGDKDWVALWLARSYLGEHRSSNSHLYQRIREARGMNYGDYAYIEYFPRGMFLTQPDTNLGRSSQIFQIWLRPLRNNKDAHFATRVAQYELHHLIKHGLTPEQFESTRNYLSKYVGLLAKSQDRQLGYALDQAYYGIDKDFISYVRDALQNMTVEDVNRAIKKYLQEENIQYVFITSDGRDMADRLISEAESAPEYNSPKPDSLRRQDEKLKAYPLDIPAANVKIVSIEDVFR